jgi:hypothetical protein
MAKGEITENRRSASFTPFEADAVSNMVVLLAVGSWLPPARVIDKLTLGVR